MEPPSSPPSEGTRAEDAVAWYKSQYELLETELAEFRESSKELEQELEKDIERVEKKERVLRDKAEGLTFEVEEWKRKYKESKAEASAAQNSLEKQITTLRDSNRTLQMKLRDIEVANDDYERQARNTTSSLEDLESKYNQAIERAVMMEEEIKIGEQEREQLRIESQRLKEEYSDLKIEAELLQDKIRKQDSRHLSTISTDLSVLGSPTFDKHDHSGGSTASSPLVTTPTDTKSLSTADTLSELNDPPSPPMSEASAPLPRSRPMKISTTNGATRKPRMPSVDNSATPRQRSRAPTTSSTTSRGPGTRLSTGGQTIRTPVNRAITNRSVSHKIPASNSLTHIRSLTAQMQRLEARVQSVRSKLPAPSRTPPRASPRSSFSASTTMPAPMTIRSRKRTTGSTASSSVAGDEPTPINYPTAPKSGHVPRLSMSGVSRLSFGPLPNRGPESEISRPSSQSSTSYARPASRNDTLPPARPMSRTSLSSGRTPLPRPRTSMGGPHNYTRSVSRAEFAEEEEWKPTRRGTYSSMDFRSSTSSIPTPGGSGIPKPGRRPSGIRRPSQGRPSISSPRPMCDLGETY